MSALQKRLAADKARFGAGVTSEERPVLQFAQTAEAQQFLNDTAQNDPEGPPNDSDIAQVQRSATVAKKAEEEARVNAAASGLDLFFDLDGAARLLVRRLNGRIDPLMVESTDATDHIRTVLETASGKRAPRELVESILAKGRAKAREQGIVRRVNRRIAQEGDAILLDLARDDGAVVHTDATGYRVEPQGAHIFLRGAGTGALPEPEQLTPQQAAAHLSAELVRWGVPAADVEIMLVVLPEYIRPGTPKPILEIVGPAGASKSTLASAIASVIDPTPKGGLPTTRITEEDLMATVQSRYVLHADNESHLSPDQQDLLCRVSTGGDLLHRKLYGQHDTAAASLQNPMVITAITPVLTRSDARSRTITLALKARRSGFASATDIKGAFDAAHPRTLGAVCALLSAGLAGLPVVKAQRNYTHRLVDFEQLGEAIHQKLGQPPGWFGSHLADRRRLDASRMSEEDALLAAVMKVVEKLEAAPVVSPVAPSDRSWARTQGAIGWDDGAGHLFIAVLFKHLLQEVRKDMWGQGDAGERIPANEKALRHAFVHRQPLLEALGWTVELRQIDDRSGLVLGRKTP